MPMWEINFCQTIATKQRTIQWIVLFTYLHTTSKSFKFALKDVLLIFVPQKGIAFSNGLRGARMSEYVFDYLNISYQHFWNKTINIRYFRKIALPMWTSEFMLLYLRGWKAYHGHKPKYQAIVLFSRYCRLIILFSLSRLRYRNRYNILRGFNILALF